MDWHDASRKDQFAFYMVSAQTPDQSIGEIEDVLLDKTTVTGAYYTDTRSLASLTFLDPSQYIPNSRVRIVHRVPDWGYENELGTFLVRNNPSIRSKATWSSTLTLNSILEGLATNLAKEPWTVASGASMKQAMKDMLSTCMVPYKIDSALDKNASSGLVYETGGSFLSRLYDLTSNTNNRIDVDGHGVVTIEPYVLPKSKTPKFRIDLADVRGLADHEISRTSTQLEIPNRCIVSYRYSERVGDDNVEREITAFKDLSGINSIESRGYVVSDYYQVSELEPATYDHALQMATDRLSARQYEKIEWSFSCLYFPVWEGDTVELVVHDGPEEFIGPKHCLVKEVQVHLGTMQMDLVLRETQSGDDTE